MPRRRETDEVDLAVALPCACGGSVRVEAGAAAAACALCGAERGLDAAARGRLDRHFARVMARRVGAGPAPPASELRVVRFVAALVFVVAYVVIAVAAAWLGGGAASEPGAWEQLAAPFGALAAAVGFLAYAARARRKRDAILGPCSGPQAIARAACGACGAFLPVIEGVTVECPLCGGRVGS